MSRRLAAVLGWPRGGRLPCNLNPGELEEADMQPLSLCRHLEKIKEI